MAFSLLRSTYAGLRYVLVALAVLSSGGAIWVCTMARAPNASWHGLPITTWSLCVPVAMVALYALSEYFYSRHNATLLESARSQVYILGYLCTITALVTFFFLMRIHPENPGIMDPKTILHVLGVALTTSFAGLLAMILLGHASGVKGIGLPTPVVEQFRKDSSEALTGVRALSDVSLQTAQSVDRLKASLENLGKTLEGFRAPLEQGEKGMQSYVSNMDNLLGALSKLKNLHLPKEGVEALQKGFAGVVGLHEASARAKVSVDRLEESMEKLAGIVETSHKGMSRLAESSQLGSNEMLRLKTCVEELKGVLDKFVEITSMQIDGR